MELFPHTSDISARNNQEHTISIESSLSYIEKKWPQIVTLEIMLDGGPFIHRQFHDESPGIRHKEFTVCIGKVFLSCKIQYSYILDDSNSELHHELEEDFIHDLTPLVVMLYSQYREERVMKEARQISHDLGNKIAQIVGSSLLLERAIASNNQLAIKKWLHGLIAGVQDTRKISTMVSSIVLSALNSSCSLKKEPRDINDFLMDILSRAGGLEELSLEFSSLIGMKRQVIFDEVELGRVIDNLIQNAIRYKRSNQEIAKLQVSLAPDLDGGILLSFRDEGKGISEGDMRTYLAAHQSVGHYERGGGIAHRESQGIGAASIMQTLINHGWKMTIESTLGEYANFTIHIPPIDCIQ